MAIRPVEQDSRRRARSVITCCTSWSSYTQAKTNYRNPDEPADGRPGRATDDRAGQVLAVVSTVEFVDERAVPNHARFHARGYSPPPACRARPPRTAREALRGRARRTNVFQSTLTSVTHQPLTRAPMLKGPRSSSEDRRASASRRTCPSGPERCRPSKRPCKPTCVYIALLFVALSRPAPYTRNIVATVASGVAAR